MAIATFASFSNTPPNTSQASRQAWLATLSSAMVAAGGTFVESVVVDAANDYSVWSFPRSPSGLQYVRAQATASSSNYAFAVTMFDSWNTQTHTGTNASFTQTATLGGAASGSIVSSFVASNNPEMPCVNIHLGGTWVYRIIMINPQNVPADWLGNYSMIAHSNDTANLDIYPSAVNGGNLAINVNSRLNLDAIPKTVANARTGKLKYFAGLVSWWMNTAAGECFGPCNSDVAYAHGSALNPLDTISDDGKFRTIWASANFSIMVRIAN